MAVATGSRQETRGEQTAILQSLTALAQRLVAEAAVAGINISAAFLVGALLIIWTSTNPFTLIGRHGFTFAGLGLILHYPFNAYVNLFSGAFGGGVCTNGACTGPNMAATSATLEQAVPLIFTGLSVAFAFRAGLFNIGAEGQLIMGAIAATWIGVSFASAPGVILLPLVLFASVLAGILWGGIAGILKAYRGAHEVISTIMLNYIAIYFTTALVTQQGPLNSKAAQGQGVTDHIGAGGQLPLLGFLGKDSTLDAGIFLALVCVALYWFVVWRTSLGYEIRAVGLNAGAAAYGGIPVRRRMVLSMMIAGALGGLAGGVYIAGPNAGSFTALFSPGWGFDGIAIALLGKGNPIGMLLAAILYAALRTGSQAMQAAGSNAHLTELLQGIIVLFIALDVIVRRQLLRRRETKKPATDEKAGTGAAYNPTVAVVNAPTSGGRPAWRGLLVLAFISATSAVLFSHVLLGGLAIVITVLYLISQRRLTPGMLGAVLYSVACLSIGLAINRYL